MAIEQFIHPGSPQWVSDDAVSACQECHRTFGVFKRRRHHCRRCGRVVCGSCSKHRVRRVSTSHIKDSNTPTVRVCNACVDKGSGKHRAHRRGIVGNGSGSVDGSSVDGSSVDGTGSSAGTRSPLNSIGDEAGSTPPPQHAPFRLPSNVETHETKENTTTKETVTDAEDKNNHKTKKTSEPSLIELLDALNAPNIIKKMRTLEDYDDYDDYDDCDDCDDYDGLRSSNSQGSGIRKNQVRASSTGSSFMGEDSDDDATSNIQNAATTTTTTTGDSNRHESSTWLTSWFGGSRGRTGTNNDATDNCVVSSFLKRYQGEVCLVRVLRYMPSSKDFQMRWRTIVQHVLIQSRMCPTDTLSMPPCFDGIQAIFRQPKTNDIVVEFNYKHPQTRTSLTSWLSGNSTGQQQRWRQQPQHQPRQRRHAWEIQSVMRQLCTGVGSLHAIGVVHGRLRAEDIEICWDPNQLSRTGGLSSQQATPIIHGLGRSVDVRGGMIHGASLWTKKELSRGTNDGSLAPEVLNGSLPQSLHPGGDLLSSGKLMATDVWSLGVVLYKILMGDVAAQVHILDGTRVEVNLNLPRDNSSGGGYSNKGNKGNKGNSSSSSSSSNNHSHNNSRNSNSPIGETKNTDDGFAFRARGLVRSMLVVEPKHRTSVQQTLFHPSFNVSIAADMIREGNVFTRDDKLVRVRQRVRDLKEQISNSSPWILDVARKTLVKQTLIRMYQKSRRLDVLRKIHVSFAGEEGVDAGGLRRDMFQTLLERVCDPNHSLHLFERSERGQVCLPTKMEMPNEAQQVNDYQLKLHMYEGLGRAFLKCIVDDIRVPCSFATILYRYLLVRPKRSLIRHSTRHSERYQAGDVREEAQEEKEEEEEQVQCPMQDLEEYDPDMAKQLQEHILSAHIGDGSTLGMDFAGMRGAISGGNRSRIPSHEILQESNKKEWVQYKMYQLLVSDRKKQLDAIRKGFWTLDLGESINRLNALDLKMLISGPSHITPKEVLNCVDFDYGEWNTASGRRGLFGQRTSDKQVLEFLKQYVSSLNERMLRLFLRFATGSSALPSREVGSNVDERETSDSSKIKFQKMKKSMRLPESHTCFNIVELPAYTDYKTLKQKMDLAILGVEVGIGKE